MEGIAKASFTGGEPLLFEDDHAELLGLCKSLGLQTESSRTGSGHASSTAGSRS